MSNARKTYTYKSYWNSSAYHHRGAISDKLSCHAGFMYLHYYFLRRKKSLGLDGVADVMRPDPARRCISARTLSAWSRSRAPTAARCTSPSSCARRTSSRAARPAHAHIYRSPPYSLLRTRCSDSKYRFIVHD